MAQWGVIAVLSAAIVIPAVFAAGIPGGTLKIKKTGSTKPQVSYSHERHSAVTDCKGCHSSMREKITAHKKCRGCHERRKGPTRCQECHRG